MRILLLTGIPGTGKTTIGDYLRDNHDFVHFDMEKPSSWPQEFQKYGSVTNHDPSLSEEFVIAAKQLGKDIIFSWGFVPITADPILGNFIKHGAVMFWFDGDRPTAKKYWHEDKPTLDELL